MSVVTLDEMKVYLRVDYEDEDSLIEDLVVASGKLCMDILRTDDEAALEEVENGKAAVTSTGYRVLFGDDIYNILSVDHMNFKRKSLKLKCERMRANA